MLEVLVLADGAVVSAEQLLEQVWDEHADPFTKTVTVTVLRLRRKLGDAAADRDRDRRRVPDPIVMSLSELRRRAFRRRSVRARIGLACAGLFLVTGGAFVIATYTLVDHSLRSIVVTSPTGVNKSLMGVCEAGKNNGTLTGVLLAKCKRTFAVGAQFGAASQRANELHQLLLWSLVGLAVATVVAGVLGWAIGGRILVPLHKVTGAARRASQEHLDERIRLDGPHDELKELADTFDDMLDRLDLAFASQRRFVANASHELRTPLTSMRTLIDVAMAKPTRTTEGLEVLVGRVREALGQSEAIIDGLLTLARSDRGLTTRELVDLEAAAQDAIDQTTTSARASNIVIEADLSGCSHPRRSRSRRAPRRQPRGQRRPVQRDWRARYKSRPAPTAASPTSRSPILGHRSPSRRWHPCSNPSRASTNESATARASGSGCRSSPRS